MRLYLSSQNVGNHANRLLEMVGSNRTVAYISNAKDYSEQERSQKIPVHKVEFEALGFQFKEFDLRNYFGKSTQLENEIKNSGLVFATGGNTFLLRRAMFDSGLDQILIKYLKTNQFVYGGSSAGSLVACPSLHGVEMADNPDAVKRIYNKQIIWEGLHLTEFYLSVHYQSDWFRAKADALVNYYKKHKLPYKTLQDGQVYTINGKNQELLS